MFSSLLDESYEDINVFKPSGLLVHSDGHVLFSACVSAMSQVDLSAALRLSSISVIFLLTNLSKDNVEKESVLLLPFLKHRLFRVSCGEGVLEPLLIVLVEVGLKWDEFVLKIGRFSISFLFIFCLSSKAENMHMFYLINTNNTESMT